MKILVCVLVLGASAFAEKMNVKVVSHTVDGNGYASSVPAAATGDADPSASSDSSSAAYVPVSTVRGSLNEVLMTLLLPDGRRVDVGCEDRPRGLTKFSRHSCKNPTADELEANFSGDKVKLSWIEDGGGKKRECETFLVLRVLPAPTLSANNH